MSSVPPEPPGEAVPGAARSSAALGQRVAGSAGLLWLLSMGLRLVSTLSMLVLARVLVPEDFGLVALAGAVIVILDVMTNFQAGAAIIKTRDPDKALFDTAFTLNIARGLLAAVVLLALAVPLAGFMETPALGPVLMALAVPLVINSFANPYFILFARDLDFRAETRRRAAAAVAGSLASIALALIFRSYWALIAGNLVQALVSVSLSWWRVPGRPGLSLARWRELLGFGGWLMLQQLAHNIGTKFDYFFIGKVLDPATLGAYHIGSQIHNLALGDAVPALAKSLFPAFSIINDDPGRLRRSYLRVQEIGAAISLPIGFGIALLAEPIVLLLLGSGWDVAILVVQILTPALSMQSFGAGVDGMAMALSRTRTLAIRQSAYIVVRTALVVGGWFTAGLLGIIIGRAVSGVIYPAYNLALGASLTQSRFIDPLLGAWRSIASVVVMSVGLLLFASAELSSLSPLWLVAYLASRVLLGALLYTGTHLMLWKLAGAPEGAEQTLLAQAGPLAGKVRRRLGLSA